MELKRCAKCGIRNTGWRQTIRNGETLCPACAQGVTRAPVEEMLEHRRAVLARMEAEYTSSGHDGPPSPQGEGKGNQGIARFIAELKNDIERLERRQDEDTKDQEGADA